MSIFVLRLLVTAHMISFAAAVEESEVDLHSFHDWQWHDEAKQWQDQMQLAYDSFTNLLSKHKQQNALKYSGDDFRIDLVISSKTFATSAHVLLNKKHGNTLFLQNMYEKYPQINPKISRNAKTIPPSTNQDNKQENLNDEHVCDNGSHSSKQFKTLYFEYILDDLRGYHMETEFAKLTNDEIKRSIDDAMYYNITPLYNAKK